jgi:hypothetical protein
MAESPKRASDHLAIPEADLGPAKKTKSSDSDDTPGILAVANKGDVVDLTSDDDSDGDSDDDSDDDGSDGASEELPPGLRPKTVSGRGVVSDFMIEYALDMQSIDNKIGAITGPLVRISLAEPSPDIRQQQRVLLGTALYYLKAAVAHTKANIKMAKKYESK